MNIGNSNIDTIDWYAQYKEQIRLDDLKYGNGLDLDNSYLYFDRCLEDHISRYIDDADELSYSEKLVRFVRFLNYHPYFLCTVKDVRRKYVGFRKRLKMKLEKEGSK